MRSKQEINLAAYIDQHQRSLRQLILGFNAVDRGLTERKRSLLKQLRDLGGEKDKEFVRMKVVGFLIEYIADDEIRKAYESVR